MLLLIDEFPSLGKLDVFQKALAFIAGYGLKALLIIQSKNQLYGEYSKEEAITDNCQLRIAFTPNRIESAKELSETVGNFTASHTQRQYSGSRLAVLLQHVNTNDQMVSRALLTPEEFMRLPATDEVVFVSGHAPIYCQKIVYYADPVMNKRRGIPPPALSFPADGTVPVPADALAPAAASGAGAQPGGGLGHEEEEDPQAVIARFIGARLIPNASPAAVASTASTDFPMKTVTDERPVAAVETLERKTRGVEERGEEGTEGDPLA
jgi:type IV secretion system protein VirD4